MICSNLFKMCVHEQKLCSVYSIEPTDDLSEVNPYSPQTPASRCFTAHLPFNHLPTRVT